MFQQLRIATLLLISLSLLTGGIYPLVVTAIAQVVFPEQARGSLLRNDQQVIGSALIGQSFTKPEFFWGRLSATAPFPYNAAASSGSNYGPLNPALADAARARIAALQHAGTTPGPVPVDLVTSSGSGLDPHISPAAADFQVPRIAAARGIPEHLLRTLIQEQTELRQWGILGEPRVNVLLLNETLKGDKLFTTPPAAGEGILDVNSRRPLGN